MAGSNENTIVAGFNVKVEKSATDLAEKEEIHVGTFNIIYKLTEWLEEQIKLKTPKIRTEKTTGRAKILKLFSQNKNKQVVGGEVLEGSISAKSKIKILRRDFEIERGTILEMQIHKTKTNEVKEGDQFGMMIEAKKEIAVGDVLEAFVVVEE